MTGIGCEYAAMRWNFKHTRMVYASESIALCVLELLVNASFSDLQGEAYTLVEIEIPDDMRVEMVDFSTLPENWNAHPSPDGLRHIGQAWIEKGEYAVLVVPSAITQESNYLINPKHPDAKRIKTALHTFSFDGRIFEAD